MLTGHGNFKGKLFQLKLANSPACICGTEKKTPEHVLFHCTRRDQFRVKLKTTVLESGTIWTCDPAYFLTTKKLYTALDGFTRQALQNTEDFDV